MSSVRLIQRNLTGKAAALWSCSPASAALPTSAPSASRLLAPLTPCLAALARLHVGPPRAAPYAPPSGPRRWPRYNRQVYPPTGPEEPSRPAYICHMKTNIKYSPKKMWYIASMIRGMSVEEALKQLQFVNKKGARVAEQALGEAQELAVREHNVEFKNNLWVAESFAVKGKVLKGLRRHARGRMGIIHYRYMHYLLRLEEGAPPAQYYTDAPLPPDQMLKQWLDQRRERTIVHSL